MERTGIWGVGGREVGIEEVGKGEMKGWVRSGRLFLRVGEWRNEGRRD